jgi:hypothetical protein
MEPDVIAESEIASPAGVPFGMLGARSQKAVLQETNHSLAVATADHGV